VWAEESGKSECWPVTGWIRIEQKQHHPMRKQADFYEVFLYKIVYRTFIGEKANECRLLHVHSPAVDARGLQMSIVEATLLPNVGSYEAGLLKGSLRKA
jgi:hypothetical protein